MANSAIESHCDSMALDKDLQSWHACRCIADIEERDLASKSAPAITGQLAAGSLDTEPVYQAFAAACSMDAYNTASTHKTL